MSYTDSSVNNEQELEVRHMAQIIELSVAALNSMTVEELIEKHSQLFDEVVEMNRSINAQCSVMSNKLRVLNQYSERIDQLI